MKFPSPDVMVDGAELVGVRPESGTELLDVTANVNLVFGVYAVTTDDLDLLVRTVGGIVDRFDARLGP